MSNDLSLPQQTVPSVPATPQVLSLAHVGNLMAMAIEKGIDLKELVDLHERLRKQQAEEEFNQAFARFQRECPAIPKNRTGGEGKYKYADLDKITSTIQPTLDDCGLTYDWDTRLEENRLKTVCTITHIAGHSRSRSFEAAITAGTRAMNDIQKSASTVTYGQRYSLLLALGITTSQADDDGAGSDCGYDNGRENASAAKAGTRQERKQQADPEAQKLLDARKARRDAVWAKWVEEKKPDTSRMMEVDSEWIEWVQRISGRKELNPKRLSTWTKEDDEAFEKCEIYFQG